MTGSLSIKDIAVGMRFKVLSPAERGDGIEFPEGAYFRVAAVNSPWIDLRCTEEGSRWMVLPVAVPEGQKNGKDYFHHVQVSIKTLN